MIGVFPFPRRNKWPCTHCVLYNTDVRKAVPVLIFHNVAIRIEPADQKCMQLCSFVSILLLTSSDDGYYPHAHDEWYITTINLVYVNKEVAIDRLCILCAHLYATRFCNAEPCKCFCIQPRTQYLLVNDWSSFYSPKKDCTTPMYNLGSWNDKKKDIVG